MLSLLCHYCVFQNMEMLLLFMFLLYYDLIHVFAGNTIIPQSYILSSDWPRSWRDTACSFLAAAGLRSSRASSSASTPSAAAATLSGQSMRNGNSAAPGSSQGSFDQRRNQALVAALHFLHGKTDFQFS